MTRLALITAIAAALVAAAVASTATAARPYHFSNRAATERAAQREFVSLARRRGLGRLTVRSIGCTKGGVGRAYCAVVATGRTSGTQTYAETITCPTDSGVGCTIRIARWPAA